MQHKILASCVIMLAMLLADGTAFAQIQAPAGSEAAEATAFTPATDFSVNGSLGARVLFLGRSEDGMALTVSAELKNLGDAPAYVALVGPTPSAVDSSGVTFTLKRVAGIAGCVSLDNQRLSDCLRNERICSAQTTLFDCLPGDVFIQLQPGASSVVALGYESEESGSGDFISFSINLAHAVESKPLNQRKRDTEGLSNVPIVFPMIQVNG